jgi:CshA-type fibril repeat protein
MMFSESGNTQTSYSTISQLLGKNPESFKKSPETYSSISIAARKTEVIVIVDAQVEDYEKLLKGIVPRVKVILLDSTENGVKQITQALREYKDLCEIHIISHGSPGCLQLGNTQLSLDTLNLYANSLQSWCANTLLLYGCNVAAGDAGIEFIEKLHQITGAKIAASANKTGNAALGGDWNLEVKTDEFDVTLALSSEAIANYNYTLPLPISNLNTEDPDATDSTITSGTVTYNFGVGTNLQITSFEDESGIQFLSEGKLEEFELKRLPNNQVQGDRQIIWYQQGDNSNSTTINLAPNQAESTTDQEAMEIALFSEIINRGTDNIFANQNNGDGNINNIERVDYISTRGLTIPESNLDGIGFLILERGGNDHFKIAAITGLDSNTGEPTAFGSLLSFAADDWGESDTGLITRVLRQEEGQDSIVSPPPISEQNIAGIFISYEDLLGENAGGNEFFGYALFPPDIDQDNDLVGLTNFPTTTSDDRGSADQRGGLDLVGGGVVYRRKDVNFPPVAGDDTATTDAGIPVPINVLENDNDSGNSRDPISIADITQPANGTATLDDNQIIYTPNPGFSGEDTFIYTITDGQDTTTATVTVTVNPPVNTPPVANPDSQTTASNSEISFNITNNDTDSDGNIDPTTVDLDPDSPGQQTSRIIPGVGSYNVDNTGLVTFVPETGFTGNSTINYTVQDNNGTPSAPAAINVTVNAPGNTAPIANPDSQTTASNTQISFNITNNDTDSDGNIDPTTVDLDPDTPGQQTSRIIPGVGSYNVDNTGLVTFIPETGFTGNSTINYTVQDNNGTPSAPAAINITVNPPVNTPPVANPDSQTTASNTQISFNITNNDTDSDGNINPTTVDLDPDSPGQQTSRIIPGVGSYNVDNTGLVTFVPETGFTGNSTINYTVQDNNGTPSAPAAINITVNPPVNTPPVANPDSQTTASNTQISFNITNNDTDSDGNINPTTVDLDPDSPGQQTSRIIPGVGSYNVDNTGLVTFVPETGFTGNSTINYTVQDNNGTPSAPAAINITVNAPGNQPPNAVDDSATTGFNTPITLNVLGNDTDPEGNSLSIADIQQDTDNGGQVVIENGQLIYTPPAGFTGNDSFSYTISDGQGGTDTATVTITVEEPANTAPDAVNDERSTRSDTAITINVLGNDSDPENDPLEISSFEATSTNGATITRSQNAQALVYTPPAGFSGTDSFSYTISDGKGGTDTATVTINVETDQTLIAANDTATTDQDTNVTINVLANDVDPENDPLEISSFEATSDNGGTITRSENGEALVYTPPAGFSGTDSFTYEVTDGSNSDTATVTITVNPPTNTKPAAIDDERRTDVNTAVTINVLTNDTDPENDPLNIESFDEISANRGTITASEDGQSLIYTPANRFVGTDTFTYTINDGRGGTDIATVTINVADQGLRPEAVDDSATTPQDTNVSINVIANDIDPDGDPLNIESFDGISANGGTITASEDGQSLIYTPARGFSGIDTFVYQVSDGTNTDIARVTVTVEPPANVPPTATDESLNTPFETPVTFNLADNISDPDGNVELSTIDLDPTTPEINQQVTLPQGRFSVNNQGQATFEPVDGFSGSVTIPFTVQDSLGATSKPANISVTVSPDANQPPTAQDVQSSSILNNSAPIPLPLSAANFSDPDGTVELINLTLPNPAEGTLLLDGVAVSDPIQVQRLTPNQLDNLTFQPNIGFAGNASFSYTVTDDDGANSNIANITVPVIAFSVPNVPGGGGVPSLPSGNLPPEAENETANIPNDGTPSVIPPLTAIDRDGSVNFYTITELPGNGTLFLNGEEITSLDQVERLTPSQAGQLTFEPDSNFTGDVSFTFTATDNEGAVSNIATVRLIVEEDDSIPRGEVIDDGGCDCPPLPEFGTVPLPEPSGLTPSTFNGFGSIDGTDESDTIPGSLGSDLVFAFAGDDRIEAFEGNDTVFGGDGDDLKFGDQGNDSLLGGDGNDTLIGSNGTQDLAASANFENDDFLYGHANNDLIQGGPGADMMYSGKQDDFSYGGKNDDMVWGDLGNDTLYGDEGNDTLVGDTADENEVEPERGLSGMIDFIWGGAGDDLINGGRSNDTLSGGVGNDTVRGGKEDDLVYGEAGDDLMYGDLGNDHLCGNEGNDTIYGDINDNETFTQSPGRDTICGGSGNDLLFGNEDNDRLCGGTESDTLYGGLGEDTLAGELGDDWLFGDEGNDLISGGSGEDRFILFSDSGTDTIQDFQLGTDFIALGGGLSFDDLTLSQSGTTTIVSLDSQQLAILNDIPVTALTESSFIAFVG